jgi:Putative bacterial sensory transduction regulator
MTNLQHPDRDLLERWLEDIHVENYLCGQCDGLHVSALHALEGVVNSRIYVEESVLYFSTALEIRPTALLPLAADLGRLNMEYPTLKVFPDVVDDNTPQLLVSASMLTGARITADQFAEFVISTLDGTRLLAEECLQLNYLFLDSEHHPPQGGRSLH